MADVSCPRCHTGYWVTGAAKWTTCPDCPAVASSMPRQDPRAALWVVAAAVLVIVAIVVHVISAAIL